MVVKIEYLLIRFLLFLTEILIRLQPHPVLYQATCTVIFLTIQKFAECYGLTFGKAYDLIEMGRKINEEKTYNNLFASEK